MRESSFLPRGIKRLNGVVSHLPIWQMVSIKLGFKAVKKCMHSSSETNSSRLAQAAECHGKSCVRVAIPYKFPMDDGFNFAVRQLWVRSGVPFMLKHAGGSQTRMRPVVWNPAGPVTKSIVPPLRLLMTALLLNHTASSFGSVIAFQTASLGCASRRSYLRVA